MDFVETYMQIYLFVASQNSGQLASAIPNRWPIPKVVAAAARRFVLIFDNTKVVNRFGDAFVRVTSPVEVLPFACKMTARRLAEIGSPVVRWQDGAPVMR